jgi:hypothetical protein
MARKLTFSGVFSALALFIVISGLLRSAVADSSIESARASSEKMNSTLHELTHVVQRGQASSGPARSIRASENGNGTAGEIQVLIDQLLAQTLELQKIYSERKLKEGSGYLNTISDNARIIKDLAQRLGSNPSSSETAQYYRRISERLRHINRAQDNHDQWIGAFSASRPSSRESVGEEIYADEYGRVKTRISHKDSGKNSETEGDPDRPLTEGRVPNAPHSGNGRDRPTESISLNYSKIKPHSVSVRGIYEYIEWHKYRNRCSTRPGLLSPDP